MPLASGVLAFEDFRFNARTRELLRVGPDGAATSIALGSRAADLLLLLLSRSGELLTKTEILEAVWPNATVEENNLSTQIAVLRRALDTGRSGVGCIQTVSGRGYRFTAQVIETAEPLLPASDPPAAAHLEPAPDAGGPLPNPPTPSPQPAISAVRAPAPHGSRRFAKRTLIGAGVAAALAAVVVTVHWLAGSVGVPAEPVARSTERPAPPRLSIVVLPFANASGEAKNDELAAAVTEDVTASFAQINGSFVVAHSMAEAIARRKLPLPEIGSNLGVRYVLEGSLGRAPNGAELRVQLSDTMSGAGVWAGQFDASAGEPGGLRSEIAQNILFPLRTEFMDAEARRISKLPAAAVSADDLVLRVRASENHQPITSTKNTENIALLERALSLEPKTAEIMIALANEILRSISYDDDPELDRADAWARVRSLAERARPLAAGSESMLHLQARMLLANGQYEEALAAFAELKQAHPTTIAYLQGMALSLMALGRSEEALPLLQDSIKLDIGSAARYDLEGNLGHALVRLGRNEEAIEWLRAAKEHSSGFSPRIHQWLAIAYAHVGKVQSAQLEFQEVAKRLTTDTVRSMRHRTWVNAAMRDDMKREIDGLAIAGMRDHVDEDADPGLPIATGLRSTNLHAPTPLGAPGVSTIRTAELAAMIAGGGSGVGDAPPLVLSTVCICNDIAFPGAFSVPALPRSPLNEEQRRSLKTWIDGLPGSSKGRRLITMSWSAEWWQSRNLAMELVALGYPNVAWYRGGLEAWDVAGLPVTRRNPNRTIAEADEAIRRDPNSASAYYNRGVAYRATGDFEHAIADLNEAIRLDPKLARAYLNRGMAYSFKNDLDHAVTDLDEAIRLDPRLAAAFNVRGGVFAAKNEYDRAVVDFDLAIRLDPKFAAAFNSRGRAYLAKGEPDRAIADFSEALRLAPKFAAALFNRASAYWTTGDFVRTIADLNEAIGLAQKAPPAAYYGRGLAYYYTGSLAKAQADFTQANELAPKQAYAALWLDIAERRGNVPGHLEQAAKQLDTHQWPAPLVRLLLGELTPAQALAAAEDKDPEIKQRQVCQANFYSGELALLQSAKSEALRLFRLAADDCPHSFDERVGAVAELKALGATP